MNIFVLDEDPKLCAEYHVNKHCTKMVLETAQLLCSVHYMNIERNLEIPYKLSHKNHPCSIWVRECFENYLWLCQLGIELSKEYTYRYGKRHKSQDIIEWCIKNKPQLKENGNITKFVLVMPEECKIGTAVDSYREYYMRHKKNIATWVKRDKPFWFFYFFFIFINV